MLPFQVQDDLAEAYRRTSFAMSRKSSAGLDVSFGKEFGWDSAAKAVVKLPFELKRTSPSQTRPPTWAMTRSRQYDVVRLSRRLTQGYAVRGSLIDRLRRKVLRQPTPRVKLKLIFVFDELDKIELDDPAYEPVNTDDGGPTGAPSKPSQSSLDSILRTLKTLFTTSGITFIFVAGKDLYDRWLEDVGRGDSVYESVFSYDRFAVYLERCGRTLFSAHRH